MQQNKEKALKQVLRAFKNESKVPIIVESKHKSIKLEKELKFVIDPEQSFLYFKTTLLRKLQYMGTIDSGAMLFYNINGKIPDPKATMGEIFDKHRSENGWLEIQIQGPSTF